MKKTVILSIIVLNCFSCFAQFKIGIRFGGAVSMARVRSESSTLQLLDNGNSIRPLFGLTGDFSIKHNVSFSTGVGYAPKKISVSYEYASRNLSGSESYRLQYLQIPLLIRFNTNEITPGLKIYFTTGFTAEFKVFDEASEQNPVIIQKFKTLDFSFNLGSGIERSIGPDTIIYGGLVYYRGLINAVKTHIDPDVALKVNNDLLGLEVGVRF